MRYKVWLTQHVGRVMYINTDADSEAAGTMATAVVEGEPETWPMTPISALLVEDVVEEPES